MNKMLAALFLSLALISCKENSQTTDKDKERIDKVCDQFMRAFSEGKVQNALQLLKQNTVMSPPTVDTLQRTIAE